MPRKSNAAKKADARARQAEQDAARAREIEEERLSRTDRIGSSALLKITDSLDGRVITARVIREYVRSQMIAPVIGRMYDIGMGVETFDVPTMAGNVVNVPASALTQLKALLGLTAIGVPTQLGLVDDDGQSLPGAIVLGELDMRAAQVHAHGDRLLGRMSEAFGHVVEPADTEHQPLSPLMQERVAAGEFTVVEMDEGIEADATNGDQAPPPLRPTLTPEQIILAKRKARRAHGG